MMENPASWGQAERVVAEALTQAEKHAAEGEVGLSEVRQVTDALRSAGLLVGEDEETVTLNKRSFDATVTLHANPRFLRALADHLEAEERGELTQGLDADGIRDLFESWREKRNTPEWRRGHVVWLRDKAAEQLAEASRLEQVDAPGTESHE